MNEQEKSRDELIAENAALRGELDEIRNREKRNATPDSMADIERYRRLISEVPEYLYSIEFDKGKIVSVFHSQRCKDITGYSPGEYGENPQLWMNMIHEKDGEKFRVFLEGLKDPLNCRSIEHRIIHKDGSVRWVVNTTTVHLDSQNSTLRQSGFLIDVTGRKEEEERNRLMLNENRHNSLVDDLTQLYNRRGFRELAEQQLRVAMRINQPALLFFIDVDKLKFTNDAFGHHAGDLLLVRLAEILRSSFRESDLVARIGGDEFTVLTMETDSDSSEAYVNRLNNNIVAANRESADGRTLSVTVGVSRFNLHDSDSVTSLIDRADRDMYKKKKNSGNIQQPSTRDDSRATPSKLCIDETERGT